MTRPQTRPKPPFYWDRTVNRYRDSKGKFLSPLSVKQEADQVNRRVAAELRRLTEQRRNNEIDLREWRYQFGEVLRNHHMTMAAAAIGGFDMMTVPHHMQLQKVIDRQLTFFGGWLDQIEAGTVNPEMELARAELYAYAGGQTFTDFDREENKLRGRTHKRNVLGIADHCRDCIRISGLGWVPIEWDRQAGYIPRGERICLTRCQCFEVYATPEQLRAWARMRPDALPPEAQAEAGAFKVVDIPLPEPGRSQELWLSNPIPEELTPEILKTLQAEEARIRQHNILPVQDRFEEGIAVDRNGAVLYRQLGKTVGQGEGYSVSMTDDQIALTQGAVFTHNHPRSNSGNSFSEADVHFLIHTKANEVRAIGNRYDYRIRMDPDLRDKVDERAHRKMIMDQYAIVRDRQKRALTTLIDKGKVTPDEADALWSHLIWDEVVRKTKGTGLTYFRIDRQDGTLSRVEYDPESETEFDMFLTERGALTPEERERWWRDPLGPDLNRDLNLEISQFRLAAQVALQEAEGREDITAPPLLRALSRDAEVVADLRYSTTALTDLDTDEMSRLPGGVVLRSHGSNTPPGVSFARDDFLSILELKLAQVRLYDMDHEFIMSVNPELIRQDPQALRSRMYQLSEGYLLELEDKLRVLSVAGKYTDEEAGALKFDYLWQELAAKHPELGLYYSKRKFPEEPEVYSYETGRETGMDRLRKEWRELVTDELGRATELGRQLEREREREWLSRLKDAGVEVAEPEAVLERVEERAETLEAGYQVMESRWSGPRPEVPQDYPLDLPPEVQEALGEAERSIRNNLLYETAILVSPSGEELWRKKGERTAVYFDSAELEQFAGNILTHNHPIFEDGSSFSLDDILIAAQESLLEMRAVGGRYTYRMRIDPVILNSPAARDAFRNRLTVAFRQHKDRAFVAYERKIKSGEWTPEQAETEGFHYLWEFLATKVHGMTYIREDTKTGEAETFTHDPPHVSRAEKIWLSHEAALERERQEARLAKTRTESRTEQIKAEREEAGLSPEPPEYELDLDRLIAREWDIEGGENPILAAYKRALANAASGSRALEIAGELAATLVREHLASSGMDAGDPMTLAFADQAKAEAIAIIEEWL